MLRFIIARAIKHHRWKKVLGIFWEEYRKEFPNESEYVSLSTISEELVKKTNCKFFVLNKD